MDILDGDLPETEVKFKSVDNLGNQIDFSSPETNGDDGTGKSKRDSKGSPSDLELSGDTYWLLDRACREAEGQGRNRNQLIPAEPSISEEMRNLQAYLDADICSVYRQRWVISPFFSFLTLL